MEELSTFIRELKGNISINKSKSTFPVRTWNEKDVINGEITDAYVIIFRTKGCSWNLKSGCTMCGYFNDSLFYNLGEGDLLKQYDYAMKHYSNERIIKIFTSGSFLDKNEIRLKERNFILNSLFKKVDKINIESRPEYVTNKVLSEIQEIINSTMFEIGIGLETSNDFIRTNAINKGFLFKDYKTAATIIHKNNFRLKSYVLQKPPFLTEKESIEDCINTFKEIKGITDIISLNPTNVQKNTLVEFLWRRRQYRPPWLWSVIEILEQGKKIVGNKRIQCDIAGGGSIRGAHNCKKCNKQFQDAISQFSLNQDLDAFKNLDCECREKWLDQLEIEYLGFGSLSNMYG